VAVLGCRERHAARVRQGEREPSVARHQAGVFTGAQAVAEGWTVRGVRDRLTRGRWHRVVGRGLSSTAAPHSPRAVAWALSLTWPDAVLSHSTAAALHGFPVSGEGVQHVIATRGRGPIRGIHVHVRSLEMDDVCVTDEGLLVTTARRTAIDCLATVPFEQALDLYAFVTSRRVLDRAQLLAAVRNGFGRQGNGQLRRLATFTRRGAVSAGEFRLHTLLDAAGLRGWAGNVPVEDRLGLIGVVDVLFAAERVVIEVDGRRAHSGDEAFERDRRRQNRLVNAGYLVLRFTWRDLTSRSPDVVSEICQALKIRAR
jgi:very-short-patch-repair endonuclease